MVGFSVGDRVVCGADKVLGNKSAKQRYGRLFRKELQGVVKGREADVAKSMWFVLTRLQLRRLFPFEVKLEAASSCREWRSWTKLYFTR